MQLLEKASRLETIVDTSAGLPGMVAAYEAAAAADASSKKAFIGVANARILLVTGDTASRWEKEEHYQKAMQEAGVPVRDAVSVLGKDDADAMGYWSFGACSYYREVVPGIAKAWNAQWIQWARIFMKRIEAGLDPMLVRWGRAKYLATAPAHETRRSGKSLLPPLAGAGASFAVNGDRPSQLNWTNGNTNCF